MRADLLLRQANLATMAEATGFGEVWNGAIAIADGKIGWLGPETQLPSSIDAAEEIDCGGGWLVPGLIDCHTHLVWAGNRSDEFEMRAHGRTYREIAEAGGGVLSTVRSTRAASEQDLFRLASARADDLIAEGVTTVEVKSGYGLDLETELKCLKVARQIGSERTVKVIPTYLGLHATPPEFLGHSDDYVDYVCQEVLPVVASTKAAVAVDAFCETIGFSLAQCGRFFSEAAKLGLAIKLHADQLSDSGGAGLVAKAGGLSADHVEYATEKSIRTMARAGTIAVLLPGAFYSIRETRRPPVELFRKHGVAMAVATDCNPGTSPCTSILTILNMACVLFGLSPSEALAGATKHAARALGLHKKIGMLKVGLDADLNLFAVEHPRDLAAYIGRNRLVLRWRLGK